MGAETTLWVSRKAALAKLAEYVFGELDNEALEQAINSRLRDSLYNVRVHYDEAHDDAEFERI
jgi:hypothetical protein